MDETLTNELSIKGPQKRPDLISLKGSLENTMNILHNQLDILRASNVAISGDVPQEAQTQAMGSNSPNCIMQELYNISEELSRTAHHLSEENERLRRTIGQ